MTHQEYKKLYERCTSGNCTPEEQRLFEEFNDSFNLSDKPWTHEMGEYNEVRGFLQADLKAKFKKRKIKFQLFYRSSAAAVLILAGAWFSAKYLAENQNPRTKIELSNNVIKPGSNKAVLTLSDGKQITLDKSKKGLLSTQSDVSVKNTEDGQLMYDKDETKNNERQVVFNTVATPRGGQYEITLSDGTRVWLNAATSLKFPVDFSGAKRTVELTGEAYFEVAKNKHKPFEVYANGTKVDVLGTHFNVKAYGDEDLTQTTLLEGSIKLTTRATAILLKVGEQGTVSNKTGLDVRRINVEDAIAWKNGLFLFRNENIQSAMKKISRWYDVDIEYQGDVFKKKLGGTVSKFENISELLNTIQLTESVHFKIEGRRVVVMP